jgi:hypothetical protein
MGSRGERFFQKGLATAVIGVLIPSVIPTLHLPDFFGTHETIDSIE